MSINKLRMAFFDAELSTDQTFVPLFPIVENDFIFLCDERAKV